MKDFLNKLYPQKLWLRILVLALPAAIILFAVAYMFAGEQRKRFPFAGEQREHFPTLPIVGDNTQDDSNETTQQNDTPPDLDPMESNRQEIEEEEFVYIDTRPRALLTGLPIDYEYELRRPIAAVINNIHVALPQSGITSADVIYEVLAEGDITRLVAVFQSYVPEKIGPVRSARDSFVDFAFNHDAIFVHHGRSPDAITRINNTRINNLDGMQLEGSVFWRDRTYPAWHANSGQRPLEHSSYTSFTRITNHLEARSIRDYVNQEPSHGFSYGFNFGEVPAADYGGIAEIVRVPFSVPYTRTFIFDEYHGVYWVENIHGAHQDAETADQVSVTNVLIQITTKRVTGQLGQRTIGTVGEGDGYFVHGGMYRPVRWAKDSHVSPMRWYFMDGTPLILAPGSTWVNVFQTTGEVSFLASAGE